MDYQDDESELKSALGDEDGLRVLRKISKADSMSSSKSKKMEESAKGDVSFYFSKVPLLQKELKNVVKNMPSEEAQKFIGELKNYNKMTDGQRS